MRPIRDRSILTTNSGHNVISSYSISLTTGTSCFMPTSGVKFSVEKRRYPIKNPWRCLFMLEYNRPHIRFPNFDSQLRALRKWLWLYTEIVVPRKSQFLFLVWKIEVCEYFVIQLFRRRLRIIFVPSCELSRNRRLWVDSGRARLEL